MVPKPIHWGTTFSPHSCPPFTSVQLVEDFLQRESSRWTETETQLSGYGDRATASHSASCAYQIKTSRSRGLGTQGNPKARSRQAKVCAGEDGAQDGLRGGPDMMIPSTRQERIFLREGMWWSILSNAFLNSFFAFDKDSVSACSEPGTISGFCQTDLSFSINALPSSQISI